MPRRNKAASQRMPERPRSRLEPVTPVKRSQNLPKVRGEMSDAVPEATHITKEQQLATGDRRKRSTRSQLEAAMAKAESGKYIRDAYGNELFVRDEVDFDHMDRGVVYAYKSNMFRVRSHDEDFSGSQPLDLLHNAMTALRREEMLLRGLQQRVPSRCGYEVQANRDQALRDFIGIEPAGDLEGIGLPLQPARRNCAPGLVSYEGESDISWQVEGMEDGVASALPNEVDQPPFINCMVRADSGNDNAEHIEAPAHGQRMISLSPCFMKTPLGGRRMIDRKRKQEHAELDENDGDDATTATFRSGNKKLRSTEETGNRCSVATTGVGLNSRRHASSTEFRVDLDHPSSSTPQSTEHATPADRGKPGPPIEASNDPGRRHDKRPHTEQVTSAYKGSHASGKKSHNMLEPRDECSDVRQTRSNGWLNIHKPQCQGGVQGDSNQSNGSSDSCVGLPEEEPLLCKWRACRRSQDDFKTLKELYQHIGTAHYGRACEWDGCNKVFATLSRQYEHVLIHVPYRAHQCHVCGKTFKMYGNLNVHYRNEHSIDVHANQTSLDYSAPPETKSASTKDVVDAMEVVDPYLRPDNGPFEMTRRLSTFDQYVNTAPQPSVARQIVIPEVNHLTHRLAEGSVLLHGEGTASASSSEQGTPERDSPEDEPADDSVTRSDRDCDDKHNSGSDPPHNMCKGEADSPGYFSSTGRSAGAHSAGQNQSLRDESLDADSKLQAALSNAEMLPNGKIACCVETSETAALESAQAAFRYQGRTPIRREIVKWQQIVDDIAAGTLESWAESRVRKAQTDLSQFELASNTKSKCDDRRLVLQQELKMAKFALEREHHYYRDVYGAMEAVPIINCLQLSPADVAKPSRQPRWEDEYGFRPIAVVFEFFSLATLVKMVRVRQDAIEIWTETSKRSPEDTACYQKKIDYTEKQVSWIRREMSRRENH
ncbi:uncharacterized protein HMPREF1541_10976 [Cyphellophora europaea CBS 101466]|uniref:pH-response transcription factor pacC/RIM101 n=1 Tax=Cyphellophora europaea (strain CBS 101466) TaxID=1220924 RepID=W2S5F3_CYPE1|nr:uncharacterized protein HMPREF1541_10976 [Cyphellophora europaea CBS 101466]ETN43845.1 hypothetical protein HMPREF1541_10976 [Cyphellophora europaea CBS 101466]